MAERAPGFDLAGAARDLDERARRYAPLEALPDVGACIRLIYRNPQLAPTIRQAIEAEMVQLPGGGVGLDQPLFTEDGQLQRRAGA